MKINFMEKEKTENLASNKESLENLEQRERVLTLLHSFYQERQKNMLVHREIGELAEKMRGLLEKAVLFIDKFYNEQSKIEERYTTRRDFLKTIRKEFVRVKYNKKFGSLWVDTPQIIKELENIFDKKLTKEEEKQLNKLIENIKETDDKINENVEKLWGIRENIARELLNEPEFSEFKDAELKKGDRIGSGESRLYDLTASLIGVKNIETSEGTKEKIIFFTEHSDPLKQLQDIFKKNNITEEELKEIKNLKWGVEEKENLKNLMEDVGEYRAEAEKLKEGLLKSANLKFKEGNANLVKDEFIRAFIRQSYEDYKLPVLHKERVVQEIMNGTFVF